MAVTWARKTLSVVGSAISGAFLEAFSAVATPWELHTLFIWPHQLTLTVSYGGSYILLLFVQILGRVPSVPSSFLHPNEAGLNNTVLVQYISTVKALSGSYIPTPFARTNTRMCFISPLLKFASFQWSGLVQYHGLLPTVKL